MMQEKNFLELLPNLHHLQHLAQVERSLGNQLETNPERKLLQSKKTNEQNNREASLQTKHLQAKNRRMRTLSAMSYLLLLRRAIPQRQLLLQQLLKTRKWSRTKIAQEMNYLLLQQKARRKWNKTKIVQEMSCSLLQERARQLLLQQPPKVRMWNKMKKAQEMSFSHLLQKPNLRQKLNKEVKHQQQKARSRKVLRLRRSMTRHAMIYLMTTNGRSWIPQRTNQQRMINQRTLTKMPKTATITSPKTIRKSITRKKIMMKMTLRRCFVVTFVA
mmetsp:Transcript_12600/g.17429  ORF Transcript_12600/g.17429 Transcript_12600/m.17429 type:complete len:273 (-) Transcript_12600:28-846(-)